jgi:hypothetical protein
VRIGWRECSRSLSPHIHPLHPTSPFPRQPPLNPIEFRQSSLPTPTPSRLPVPPLNLLLSPERTAARQRPLEPRLYRDFCEPVDEMQIFVKTLTGKSESCSVLQGWSGAGGEKERARKDTRRER